MGIEAGYRIYNPDNKKEYYDFDKLVGSGNTTQPVQYEENRLELKTFGAVPYVYYAGNTDYVTFDLHGIFVSEYDGDEKMVRSSKTIFRNFKKLLRERKPLIVENSLGEQIECDVSLINRAAPFLFVEEDMDFIEVVVKCVQIA